MFYPFFTVRCPDFPHLRRFAPVGMPLLTAEVFTKYTFALCWSCFGVEVIFE